MTAKKPLRTLEEILAGIPPLEELRITTTTMLAPAGRAGLRLSTKSVVDYKKRANPLCPVIIADPFQTHADLLRIVADALARSYNLPKAGGQNG